MAFEIFDNTKRKSKPSPRQDELKTMFEILFSNSNSAAKIDMEPPNIYAYAKKLGYKIHVTDNRDGTSTVTVDGKKAILN